MNPDLQYVDWQLILVSTYRLGERMVMYVGFCGNKSLFHFELSELGSVI